MMGCPDCDAREAHACEANERFVAREAEREKRDARGCHAVLGMVLGAFLGGAATDVFGSPDPGWRRAVSLLLVPLVGILFWIQSGEGRWLSDVEDGS